MNRIRSVLAWLVTQLVVFVAWLVAPDPGAWKRAAREVLQAFVVTATATLYALNIAWPGNLEEAKAQAMLVIATVVVPVGYAVVGAIRAKIVPLIAARLAGILTSLLVRLNALA